MKISFTMKSGRNDYGDETTRGGGGAKRPGRKRLGGETTRGGNGLGAKRLGFGGAGGGVGKSILIGI